LFVALAILATRRGHATALRRTRVSRLLLFATATSLFIGITGREAWPFSAWPMDNALIPQDFRYLAPVAVDLAGREFPIDPRAFEPLPWVDLSTWMSRPGHLDTAQEAEIGPFLLKTVQGARQRAAAGADVGTYRRRLGILAAPNTQLSPDRWVAHSPALPDSVAQLRVYEYRTDLDGPVVTAVQQPSRLVFEFPRLKQ
jgi:hypothetical protein